ncbi:hypothetical protein CKAH01_18425 [Colletotrichum kahawae]|uniref:Uncharacterized protein n=1 Tax=Colletotrichum kahawae TaxID=34407 RepID=A0AAE0D1Z7_COLKA|nr:hypothetical protein CKAH01_18425 [Colletotrichum kahawae]
MRAGEHAVVCRHDRPSCPGLRAGWVGGYSVSSSTSAIVELGGLLTTVFFNSS